MIMIQARSSDSSKNQRLVFFDDFDMTFESENDWLVRFFDDDVIGRTDDD